jgi:ketosteroid isomerase-like protein
MRELVDRYLDAYNRKDVEAMLATMHPAVVFENHTAGVLGVRTQGLAELRQLAEASRQLFSARRQTITDWQQRGDRAFAQILFEGTFAVDLPNGVRAGQSISLIGRSEFHQHEGRLDFIADHSD